MQLMRSYFCFQKTRTNRRSGPEALERLLHTISSATRLCFAEKKVMHMALTASVGVPSLREELLQKNGDLGYCVRFSLIQQI